MRLTFALLMLPALPIVPVSVPALAQVAQAGVQDAALLQFLDDAFDERVNLSPETQTQLGYKSSYDRLDDYTDAGAVREQDLAEQQLKEMRARFVCSNMMSSAAANPSPFANCAFR